MTTSLAHKKKVKKVRAKIARLGVARLSVHRTSGHIYAQIINPNGKVLASASSLEKIIREQKNNNKIEVAKLVGKSVAERGKEAKVVKVAFDRAWFKYHGRVKALADAAREFGLNF